MKCALPTLTRDTDTHTVIDSNLLFLQMMFEQYQFKGVYIAIQAVLTLYAQGEQFQHAPSVASGLLVLPTTDTVHQFYMAHSVTTGRYSEVVSLVTRRFSCCSWALLSTTHLLT